MHLRWSIPNRAAAAAPVPRAAVTVPRAAPARLRQAALPAAPARPVAPAPMAPRPWGIQVRKRYRPLNRTRARRPTERQPDCHTTRNRLVTQNQTDRDRTWRDPHRDALRVGSEENRGSEVRTGCKQPLHPDPSEKLRIMAPTDWIGAISRLPQIAANFFQTCWSLRPLQENQVSTCWLHYRRALAVSHATT